MSLGRQCRTRPHQFWSQTLGAVGSRPRNACAVLVLCLAVGVLVGGLAGTGGGTIPGGQYEHNASSDDQPPSLHSGTRVNDTAVRLLLVDNHDIDESSITPGDFVTEVGSVTNVTVNESGSNATVTLLLDGPVNEENLTVGRVGGAAIEDTNGNLLGQTGSTETVVVSNMDSIAPNIIGFSATDATGGPARLRVRADERLDRFNITVAGAVEDSLGRSDFEAVGSGSTYETTYEPSADGTVRFTLYNYADSVGNTGPVEFTERIRVDLTPPTAVASLDLAQSRNLSIVFDGRQSTDTNGVAGYTWQFGDGSTATGQRVTHSYVPGNYTVTLNVTDVYGNAATDSLVLNLTSGAGDVTNVSDADLRARLASDETSVSVQRPDGTVTDQAVVTVERAHAGAALDIGAVATSQNRTNGTAYSLNGTALARHSNVTLGGLTVTLRENRSLTLALSMTGPGAASGVVGATGRQRLAGFTVIHGVPDSTIASANFTFSVSNDRLDTLGVHPGTVSLARLHNGTWRSLPTTALNETSGTNGTQLFRAHSSGFSQFAVTANTSRTPASEETNTDDSSSSDDGDDDSGTPSFDVTDISLPTREVSGGGPVRVNVTVANSGNTSGTYTAGLTLNGSVVATAQSPSISAGSSRTVQITHTADAGTYAVGVNGTSGGTVTVTNSSDASTAAPEMTVTNVTLAQSTLAPGETLTVNVTVQNGDDRPSVYTAALALNGGVVATNSSPPIEAGQSRTFQIQHTMNRTGDFSVSVNRTNGGSVTVESEGGGLLAPVFGVLSFLPMGVIRPAVLFGILPLTLVYVILKGLAIYLGY